MMDRNRDKEIRKTSELEKLVVRGQGSGVRKTGDASSLDPAHYSCKFCLEGYVFLEKYTDGHRITSIHNPAQLLNPDL
jgi:hypothetical protein